MEALLKNAANWEHHRFFLQQNQAVNHEELAMGPYHSSLANYETTRGIQILCQTFHHGLLSPQDLFSLNVGPGKGARDASHMGDTMSNCGKSMTTIQQLMFSHRGNIDENHGKKIDNSYNIEIFDM